MDETSVFFENISRFKKQSIEKVKTVSLATVRSSIIDCIIRRNKEKTTRGKSLLEIVGYHFSSRLTATLNLCQIFLILLVHGL